MLDPGIGSPNAAAFLKEKKFVCTECGHGFDKKSRLERHILSHTGERPYKCTWEGCDKSFFRKDHLQRHTDASHTGVRRLNCPEKGCGKTFYEHSHLKRHIQWHSMRGNKDESTAEFNGKDVNIPKQVGRELLNVNEVKPETVSTSLNRLQSTFSATGVDHTNIKPASSRLTRVWRCPHCERMSTKKHRIRDHLQKVHGYCEKTSSELIPTCVFRPSSHGSDSLTTASVRTQDTADSAPIPAPNLVEPVYLRRDTPTKRDRTDSHNMMTGSRLSISGNAVVLGLAKNHDRMHPPPLVPSPMQDLGSIPYLDAQAEQPQSQIQCTPLHRHHPCPATSVSVPSFHPVPHSALPVPPTPPLPLTLPVTLAAAAAGVPFSPLTPGIGSSMSNPSNPSNPSNSSNPYFDPTRNRGFSMAPALEQTQRLDGCVDAGIGGDAVAHALPRTLSFASEGANGLEAFDGLDGFLSSDSDTLPLVPIKENELTTLPEHLVPQIMDLLYHTCPFSDTGCMEKFSAQKDLRAHIKNTHAGHALACKACNREFLNFKAYSRHITECSATTAFVSEPKASHLYTGGPRRKHQPSNAIDDMFPLNERKTSIDLSNVHIPHPPPMNQMSWFLCEALGIPHDKEFREEANEAAVNSNAPNKGGPECDQATAAHLQ